MGAVLSCCRFHHLPPEDAVRLPTEEECALFTNEAAINALLLRCNFLEALRRREVNNTFRRLGSTRDFMQSFNALADTKPYLLFLHTKPNLGEFGTLRGYNEEGVKRFTYSLVRPEPDHRLDGAILPEEFPALIAADGNLFLFALTPFRGNLLVLNPFLHLWRRVKWPFEIKDEVEPFLNVKHVKFTVLDSDLFRFRLIYGEFLWDQGSIMHYQLDYDPAAVPDVRGLARPVIQAAGTHQLHKADPRSLLMYDDQGMAYQISFSNADSSDPLCFVPPEDSEFYSVVDTAPMEHFMPTAGFTDLWSKYFNGRWQVHVNQALGYRSPTFRLVLKSVLVFKLNDDWNGFQYVSCLPDRMLQRIQLTTGSYLMSVKPEEAQPGVLSLSIFKTFRGASNWEVFRFSYNIQNRTWTEFPKITFDQVRRVHASFMLRPNFTPLMCPR